MRVLALLALQTLQARRRFLPMMPLRVSSLERTGQLRIWGRTRVASCRGEGAAWLCLAASQRRGLGLNWYTSQTPLSLLDMPHTKRYRYAFDERLYSSKRRRQLRRRTRVLLQTAYTPTAFGRCLLGTPFYSELNT
jgi:hypothetical protein